MWVFLLFLAVPLIEIGLFVQIGGTIGVWGTLAWVFVSAALGLFVLRRIGTVGAAALKRDMAAMGDPLSPLAHRALQVVGAMLLLLPGFLTDGFGLLLLVGPLRTLLIGLVARRVKTVKTGPQTATVIEGDWREVEEDEPAARREKPSGWTQH